MKTSRMIRCPMFLMMKLVIKIGVRCYWVACTAGNIFVILQNMDILQLSHYLDNLLDVRAIQDHPNAVNGLQVQNRGEIQKIGLAVDCCAATIAMAAEQNCNMLLVHHGLFWGGLQPVRGTYYDKMEAMIRANLGLYSAHIPLDLHPVLGNSKMLADLAGLSRLQPFGEYDGQKIGFKGEVAPQSAAALGRSLEKKLGASVKVIGEAEVRTVGLVTGGAADILRQAALEGLDCYITGEGSNHHFHEAIEAGCVLILAGHYATETGGVRAVGRHLEEKFSLQTVFLDYPTGM